MVNKTTIQLFKQAGIVASLFCVILLSNCTTREKIIAKVGDVALTENDAILLLKEQGVLIPDSSNFKTITEEWIEGELFSQELQKNHPEEWKILQLKSSLYKAELSKFKIEQYELRKQIDTLVSENEINEYYQSHLNEFKLQDYLVKALYLKIPKEINFKSSGIQKSYLLKNDKDLSEVNSYAKLYAENYYFNDSSWAYLREIIKDIPVKLYNVDNIVLNRSKTYFSDENYTFFINIIDFKLKNDAPPVSFLEKKIKQIIIASRLQKLHKQVESNLIQQLKKENEIIINL